MKPRWEIGSTGALWFAFALIFGHYVAAYGVGGVLAIVLELDRRELWQGTLVAFIVVGTGAILEIGLVLRLGMRYARLSFRDAGWRDFAARDIAYGLAGFVLCAASLACILAAQDGWSDTIEYIVDRVANYTPQQRVFFLMMGLIAAFPEDTIFRGIMQPTLQTKLGRWQGILLTTLIFAVYHFRFAPPQLAGKICYGLIFGLMRERTGTLWAPAIAHVLAWAILGAI
jgi:membrane protease YdiL (CAAX protease family)